MKPIISIIVPIYNVEKYLCQAVNSLLKQVEYDYEIILVDDGSQDSSKEICDSYMDKYPDIIKVVHKDNGGLPSARKAGVKVSEGKYVSFLDGDDWCSPDYYYNMVQIAEKHELDVVCSVFTYANNGQYNVYKGKIDSGIYSGSDICELKKKILYMPPYYSFGIIPSLCMKVIHKSLIEKYIYSVPNNITLAEDALCSYPILFYAKNIGVLNENVGYYYRYNPLSMSNAYDKNKNCKIIKAGNYFYSVMREYYSDYKKQINCYISQLIKDSIKNESLSSKIGELQLKHLEELRNQEWVDLSVNDLSETPLKYKIYFSLFRARKYTLLLKSMKLKNNLCNKLKLSER